MFTLLAVCGLACAATPVADVPFAQEYRTFHLLEDAANNVADIAIDSTGAPVAATAAGVYRLKEDTWQPRFESGPAFAVLNAGGKLYVGAWDGLYKLNAATVERVGGVEGPVSVLGVAPDGAVVAMGPNGMWRENGGDWTHARGSWANSPRAVVALEGGLCWVPTGHGLFRVENGSVTAHFRDKTELRSGELRDAALAPDGRLWIGGTNGIDIYENGARVKSLTPADGLPHSQVHCITFGPAGRAWIGTACGVARYKGGAWSLRHSKRWLPNDDVRAVAFDSDGTAWVATAAGVSAIRTRMMTLAEKADYFNRIVHERKVRKPWLVEKTRLLTPGDISTSSHEDDDNDGQYTNMYMAAEAYRYAVTGAPEAREHALRAFEAMEFLQTVTETDGFIARTVVPTSWTAADNPNPFRLHDRNREYTPQQRAARRVEDPRYKPVEVRWHPTPDGAWLWKGDTSSDEVTGHFYGYWIVHEFVAEADAERARLQNLVRRVMDYIIEGGYVFKGVDGTHTRWGVWSPELLFGNLDWRAERNINCTELLSYLKTAYHITGDKKYQREYRKLIEKHGYLEAARHPKTDNPSEFTHIDDELLALTLPGLLTSEKDPELRAAYEEGVRQWHSVTADEDNPYYNFTMAALGGPDIDVEACVAFLRDAPLDLIRWTVDNAKREDVELVRRPELDHWQTSRLLPPSERGVMRWDKNPWSAVRGDGGRTESSGVYWLLPYWMGRYYGFIAAPE